MTRRKMTLNIPAELIDGLQSMGVRNVTEFLESFFGEIEAEDLLAIMEEEEEYWDEDTRNSRKTTTSRSHRFRHTSA